MNQNPFCPPEVPFPEPHPSQTGDAQTSIPIVFEEETEGMSLRTYAAIQLRVPDSGIDWLDAMIERSRRLDKL